MEIINGPVAPVRSNVIYHITLANGAIITNPEFFIDTVEQEVLSQEIIIAEDGTILTGSRSPRITQQFEG